MPPTNTKSEPGRTSASEGAGTPSGPSLLLPKGGGAIRSIGEKFGANPATGTGSITVPIFISPGRSDFHPRLALSYDSGSGNGTFGLGWKLPIPAITRKTDKGLPLYSDFEESDIYLLSDSEDLVPALVQNGTDWKHDFRPAQVNGRTYTVRQYRPRIEGLFARIERWSEDSTGDIFWKTVAKDNLTSLYGRSPSARISHPADHSHIFQWLLEQTHDDRGNVMVYRYKAEDNTGVPQSVFEQNRPSPSNRYLKQIDYGAVLPFYPDDTLAEPVPLPTQWLFHVVLDYGEHNLTLPRITEDDPWSPRPDPFSAYRSTFEIRTHRLCRRILMFHDFPELGENPTLVRSTDFSYNLNPTASFLVAAAQTGYIRNQLDGTYSLQDGLGNTLSPLSLPPVRFSYSAIAVDQTLHQVEASVLENMPGSVPASRCQWLDLDSEGSPGILTRVRGGWYYSRNDSNLLRGDAGQLVSDEDPAASVRAHFEPSAIVGTVPSLATEPEGTRFLDLDGSGTQFAVQLERPTSGFFERDDEDNWNLFVAFSKSPNLDWSDPNLKWLDLSGDGTADLLITEDEVLSWYPSLGRQGFGSGRRVSASLNEDDGPALIFADGTQSIYTADFSGDGLTDLVRIRNGEICYWPNLGYGRFGAKIVMDNAPIFDLPDTFDQTRVRLADIDGSGTTDIIYLGRETISLFFNLSGNSWSDSNTIAQFPTTDDLATVTVLDLLGNGTACLIWSSPLPDAESRPMRYIDLMGGQKPHLLVGFSNSLGTETRISYTSSTRFYLQDRAAGKPWLTRLPFPVHVVDRIESFDYASATKLVTRYSYHHGYFDGIEREFRGFGMVEQVDTESFSKYSGTGLFTQLPDIAGEEFHLPPVRTRSFFHTGVFLSLDRITRHYADEYFKGDALAQPLPETILPPLLSADEAREACRALKGKLVHQETYADDGTPQASSPFSVTDCAFTVQTIQPKREERHAVFHGYQSECISYHYERNSSDPRTVHELSLEVKDFGQVTRQATIAYGRRPPAAPGPALPDEQTQPLVTYQEVDYANHAEHPDWYRIGLPVETRQFEITGLALLAPGSNYRLSDLASSLPTAPQIAFEHVPTPGLLQKRLTTRTRTIYRKNDLSAPLPTGTFESLAIPFDTYKQVFTPGLLTRTYNAKLTAGQLTAILSGPGGYHDLDGTGTWWAGSGRVFFSPDPNAPDPVFARSHFFLAQGSVDPFGNTTTSTFDAHNLIVRQSTDAIGNVLDAQMHYRVLLPWLLTDSNRNRAAVRFDALGNVVATAVLGKDGANEGDSLNLNSIEISATDDPTTRLEYSLLEWTLHNRPNFVHGSSREQHRIAGPWQESYTYFDGLGREVMKKIQAEPGPAPARDASGALKHDGAGKLIVEDTASRWIGSGRTVFDNKGNALKKYEPFFSATRDFEPEKDLRESGVTAILRYDALSRLIRTDLPNGSFSGVRFDPWQTTTSDPNDNVLESRWHADRVGLPNPDREKKADTATLPHAHTPAIALLDVLGRTFLTVADNGAAGRSESRFRLDILGNRLGVIDALGRPVATFDYQMTARRIHSTSTDAGERWSLDDAAGKNLHAWNSRSFHEQRIYDPLQRITQLFLQTGESPKQLAQRTTYGEGQPNDVTLNLRAKVFQIFDAAGVATNDAFDFKNNLLSTSRQLLTDIHNQVDWLLNPSLDPETFSSSTTFDALNRTIAATAPDGSVLTNSYNEANLLKQLDISFGAGAPTPFVTAIEYNARGQRLRVQYGNGSATAYTYDPETFALSRLTTTRVSDGATLQDLTYTYDPSGNVTSVGDAAQQAIYFNNAVVSASADYTYDPLYHLSTATGRELIGLLAQPQPSTDDAPRINQPLPSDGSAVRSYTESFTYDAVGNMLTTVHQALNGNWTRTYAYDEPHVAPQNNRLTSTSVGAQTDRFLYDLQGNMIAMPHLAVMEWDFRDQLHRADLGGGGAQYSVYDGTRNRVRKIVERRGGLIEDRIYLNGYEIYRRRVNGVVALERHTLHVLDGQRRIALVETKTIDSSIAAFAPLRITRYQFDNLVKSASLELDDAAAIISYEEYYPFGSTSFQAVAAAIDVSRKRYRYTGKERDEDTGLYYNGARYYAPWLARWTSCDPQEMVNGTNLYQYVLSNPIRLNDPTGTDGTPPQQDEILYDLVRVPVDPSGPPRPSLRLVFRGFQHAPEPPPPPPTPIPDPDPPAPAATAHDDPQPINQPSVNQTAQGLDPLAASIAVGGQGSFLSGYSNSYALALGVYKFGETGGLEATGNIGGALTGGTYTGGTGSLGLHLWLTPGRNNFAAYLAATQTWGAGPSGGANIGGTGTLVYERLFGGPNRDHPLFTLTADLNLGVSQTGQITAAGAPGDTPPSTYLNNPFTIGGGAMGTFNLGYYTDSKTARFQVFGEIYGSHTGGAPLSSTSAPGETSSLGGGIGGLYNARANGGRNIFSIGPTVGLRTQWDTVGNQTYNATGVYAGGVAGVAWY